MSTKQEEQTYNSAYLGDGVYASFDGYRIVLDLRAQGPDRIVLEPEVFQALVKFQKTMLDEAVPA